MAFSSRQRKSSLAEAENEAQRGQQQLDQLQKDIQGRQGVRAACDDEHRKAQGELAAAKEASAQLVSGSQNLAANLERTRQEAFVIKSEVKTHEQETRKIQASSAELKKRIARLRLTRDQLMAAQAQMAPVASSLPLLRDAEEEDYGRAGKPLAHLAKSAQLREGESQEAMRSETVAAIAETVELERECKDWSTKAAALREEIATLATEHSAFQGLNAIVAASAQKFEDENNTLQDATKAAKDRLDTARNEHDRLQDAIRRADEDISLQNTHMQALKFKLRTEVNPVGPRIKESDMQARQADDVLSQKIAEIAKWGQLAHGEKDARERDRRSRTAALALLRQQTPPSKPPPHPSKPSGTPGMAPSCFPTREAPTPRSTVRSASVGATSPAPPTGLADRSGSSTVRSRASSAAESFAQQGPPAPLPIHEMRLPELRGSVRSPGSARLSHAGRLVVG